MAMTVNIRYTGKNGNARKFAEEMNRVRHRGRHPDGSRKPAV